MNNSEKIKYRNWAKNLRQALDLKRKSAEIVSKILKLKEYISAKNVMSYIAKDIEVSLRDLFKDKTKNWFLPTIGDVKNEQILIVPYYDKKTSLHKGNFDILQPEIIGANYFDQVEKQIKLDVIFVPGLCFDKHGNRIGFGAGYYDRFLKLNKNSFKIGCCPKECIVESLPKDVWDIPMDMVLTD